MGMAAATISKQIVWSYRPTLPNSFYSSFISGAQRLPNGNTLVCSGAHGHLFELTTDGDIVWEYISPVGDRTRDVYGIYTTMTDAADRHFNSLFKCARYAPDYPGLAGRDLTPMGQITEVFTSEAARPAP